MDYTGPVNYETVDRLLLDLKKNDKFKGIQKLIARRVYSILVECLENIARHSLNNFPPFVSRQPFITAGISGENIIIRTGNVVPEDKKTWLSTKIDHVNRLDHEALVNLYEEKINRVTTPNGNGAELGFIIMRIKSKNSIEYNFIDHKNGLSDFEIKITINRHIP